MTGYIHQGVQQLYDEHRKSLRFEPNLGLNLYKDLLYYVLQVW